MPDRFGDTGHVFDAPATDAFEITPSDSTNFNENCRAIYVGTGGDITLVTKGGQTVTFVQVPSGAILPIRASRVNATGTDADDLIGLI